jgi:hypothetical protein
MKTVVLNLLRNLRRKQLIKRCFDMNVPILGYGPKQRLANRVGYAEKIRQDDTLLEIGDSIYSKAIRWLS